MIQYGLLRNATIYTRSRYLVWNYGFLNETWYKIEKTLNALTGQVNPLKTAGRNLGNSPRYVGVKSPKGAPGGLANAQRPGHAKWVRGWAQLELTDA